MPAAIERGTVGAAHFGEPFLTAAGPAVRRFATPYDVIGKRFLISDWFTTRGWLSANPAIAKRLIDAIYATARWTNANHDASALILSKYTKIDADLIRKMSRVNYATSLGPQLIQPVASTRRFTYGGLTRQLSTRAN